MTEQNEERRAILIDWGEGAAYAEPLAVLEANRATPEQRAEAEAAMVEVAGYAARATGASDSQGEEPPLYALTAADLEPYRLSDEEARAAEGNDTAGFWSLSGGPSYFRLGPGGSNTGLTGDGTTCRRTVVPIRTTTSGPCLPASESRGVGSPDHTPTGGNALVGPPAPGIEAG